MKKLLATLLTLALIVSASFVLMVPASAAAATADDVTVTLKDGTKAALDGTTKGVSFKDGVLTLENVELQVVHWTANDLVVVVKGTVDISTPTGVRFPLTKNATSNKGGAYSKLTVRLEGGAKLNVNEGASDYAIINDGGDIVFEGDGEVTVNAAATDAIALFARAKGNEHPNLIVRGNVTLNASANGNVVYQATDANTPAGPISILAEDNAKVTLTARNNDVVTIPTADSGWDVTVSGNASVTMVAQGASGKVSAAAPSDIKAGTDSKITVVAGDDEKSAKEVSGDTMLLTVAGSKYLKVTSQSTKAPADTSSDDTSSSTNTGGNAGTSDSNLWVAAVSVMAVVAVAGVVVLSLRKKTND